MNASRNQSRSKLLLIVTDSVNPCPLRDPASRYELTFALRVSCICEWATASLPSSGTARAFSSFLKIASTFETSHCGTSSAHFHKSNLAFDDFLILSKISQKKETLTQLFIGCIKARKTRSTFRISCFLSKQTCIWVCPSVTHILLLVIAILVPNNFKETSFRMIMNFETDRHVLFVR